MKKALRFLLLLARVILILPALAIGGVVGAWTEAAIEAYKWGRTDFYDAK